MIGTLGAMNSSEPTPQASLVGFRFIRGRVRQPSAILAFWIGAVLQFFDFSATAASQILTIDLLGKKYDVYQIPSLGGIGPTIKALNNRVAYDLGPFGVEYVATAVGTMNGAAGVGDAATFSPTGGPSLLIPNRRIGEYSQAEDISDTGVVIGWHYERDLGKLPRAFIFSNTNGLQYLDEMFPSVKALAEQFYPPGSSNPQQYGSKGFRINSEGVMIIESVPHADGTHYRVSPDGGVTPLNSVECQRFDLNNFGQLPPPGRGGEPCESVNTLINDAGAYAGGSPSGHVTLNDEKLPNSQGSGATSLNNLGYIGAGPATIFGPNGEKIDLIAELLRQAPDHELAENWRRPGIFSATFINDAGDISWANLYFTPACPSLTVSLSGTGFEFINGKLSVRVGRTYSVTTRVVNSGRATARNFQVERPPGPKFFRILSGPTPGIPAELLPGQSAEWTLQLKAIGPGSYSGISVISADSDCGRVEVQQPVATEFVGDPEKIVVNSTADRGRKAGADCCDTGEDLPNGDPECTLRAAIEAANAGCGDIIEFNVPGAAVPKISPATPLPAITVPVVLDATTQSGGLVELDGTAVNAPGLDITGGKSVVRGFVIGGFAGDQAMGLRLSGAGENEVIGNLFGTDVTGNGLRTNLLAIRVENSPRNIIGGGSAGEANVIAAEVGGIVISGASAQGNRVLGNRIGLGKNGAFLKTGVGVAVGGATGTIIGGDGELGNRIAGEIGILLSGGESDGTSGIVVQGNRVGLDDAGNAAEDAVVGIWLLAAPTNSVIGTRIVGNFVAGHVMDVDVAGDGARQTQVVDNQVGLKFDGSGVPPGGVGTSVGLGHPIGQFGIRIEGAPDTRIKGNTVAGHKYDILVAGGLQFYYPTTNTISISEPDDPLENPPAGSAATGNTVEENTVGLNRANAVPPGTNALVGISVFGGAEEVHIRNNVVAGHVESEVWLVDGAEHIVAGNRLGTPDGIDRGSQTGLLIDDSETVTVGPSGIAPGNTVGFNAVAGIHLRGAAVDPLIRLNQIGTDPGGNAAWPNGMGIKTGETNEPGTASGVRIENNVISGNTKGGVVLTLTNETLLQGNRIGISPNGIALPNEIGVVVGGTPVRLLQNIVAHNKISGIAIVGTEPALIQGGPIYANGTGLGLDGILYEVPPFPPPAPPLIMRSNPDANGKVTVVYLMGAVGGDGDVEVEIYGNRQSESQGRTPLVRKTVKSSEPLIAKMEVAESAAFAVLENFTATASRDGRTSAFSAAVPALSFELSKPRAVAVSDTELTLQWSGSPFIVPEQADDPTGPWEPVTAQPVIGADGTAVLTLPIQAGSKFFRLRLNL